MSPIVLLMGVICLGCIETFDFESEIEDFESALVIEATVTNELKHQQILLSRTFQLQDSLVQPERNAGVSIIDNASTEFAFHETDPGVYVSDQEFKALPNKDYILSINTSNGKHYKSSSMQLTKSTTMDNLYAERDYNEDGEEGVSIYIDSYDPTGTSKYYRHEYEEAYKIIAPRWISDDLHCEESLTGTEYWFETRPYEELICYNVVKSNSILITNTLSLEEDRLQQHRIRFLNRNNYIISHRYSIEVKQYIQSPEAYNYYETLKKVTQSESLFSENQPGYLEGNIKSLDHQNEKVVGFFEVTAVAAKRIYFNYEDFFLGETSPPFAVGCTPYSPKPDDLCDEINYNGNKFYKLNEPIGPNETFALLVPEECGDCTSLGKTEAPDFWIE